MTIAENDPRPSRTEERWFGLLLLSVFAILGTVIGWQLGSPRLTRLAIGIGGGLAVLYYAVRSLRIPFYRTWMAVTMPLGHALSTAILATIFYLALTPMAWFMKVIGRDHLQGHFDPSAQTYWTPYNPGEDEDRYFRQS